MKKSAQLVLSVFLCLAIAAGCYFWATGMISSNYAYRSPIKNTPPQAGEKLGNSSTQRVVVVLIDGLRYDTSQDANTMPTLAKLRAQGASARMHSQAPSFSEPGYSTIFTGAWPWVNDGPAFNLDYADIPTWTQDNLFAAAHDAGIRTAISGYYWFEKLVPQQDVDLSFYTPGEDRKADEDVMAAVLPWLQNNEAQLVLIHLDQVDYAGHHEGGAKAPAWNQAASRCDDDLAQIAATLDFSKDTLLVISDHGHIDAGGHGGQDPIVLQEPFVLVGAGVKPGEYGDLNMVDVSPTLAALLGTRLPASAQGEVRTAMLNLDSSVLSNLDSATRSQQTQLVTAYTTAIRRPIEANQIPTGSDVSQYQQLMSAQRLARETSERIPRFLLVLAVLALFVFWLVKNKKNGIAAWIIGALAFALLFNFRYGMWDRRTYSLSSITSQTELMTYVAITALLAALIAWLAIFLDQRYFKRTPADAALSTFKLFFTMAFLNGLPALFSFALNGAVVTWTLPDYLSSFLALLSLIQVLVIAVSALIFAGIAALIARRTLKKSLKKA